MAAAVLRTENDGGGPSAVLGVFAAPNCSRRWMDRAAGWAHPGVRNELSRDQHTAVCAPGSSSMCRIVNSFRNEFPGTITPRHRNPGGKSRNAYRQADEQIAPGATSTPANAIDVVQRLNQRFAVDAPNPEMCFEDPASAAARTPRMKERSAALARPQLWADRSPLDRSVCFQLVPSSQAVRPSWLPNERAQGDVRPPARLAE